jgi:hypothetical protein
MLTVYLADRRLFKRVVLGTHPFVRYLRLTGPRVLHTTDLIASKRRAK